jgi:transposase
MVTKANFVGIDVSQEKNDVRVYNNSQEFIIANTNLGLEEMIKKLEEMKIDPKDTFFCFENTGAYSKKLERFLDDNGFEFYKAHPFLIKYSMGGKPGKSDKIDAKKIAIFAYKNREFINASMASSPTMDKLRGLQTIRDHHVKTKTSEQNMLSIYRKTLEYRDDSFEVKGIVELITFLRTKIKETEAEIQKVIKSDPSIYENYKLILSVCGIGPVVAVAMLIYTDNFTKFINARKFNKYCGMIPLENESGKLIKKKKIGRMGNKTMKALLDRGALSVIEHNEEMKAFYERRVSEGKPKRVVINIIRCKIVERAFTVIRTRKPFIKNVLEYRKSIDKNKNLVMS